MNYSVLMTVYKKDSPEYFIQSVSSMLKQTVKTNDFVLICDGPITEELDRAIVTAFRGNEEILNLVRLPQNVGLGQALHDGLPLCKNNWVARMDDDDISHPDRCEVELKYIEEHQGLSIVGSYVNEFEDKPEKPIRVKEVPVLESDILRFSKRRNPFNHSTLMINRDDIIAAGNYSTMRTNQDVDTWVRVLNKGYKGVNIAQPLVDFRFDKSTYKRRKEWKNIKLMIDVWRNFWKQHYCSFGDYAYVVFMQLAVFFMPGKLLQWAYDHLR
ncbi:glycosyl transferase family 2 [Ruminococcaceae bacterium R-25]|nr:glycosyl transferase family 2 [Ruminococcaceae bacterium R-25]SUQ11332.1 Glycosyl transferase family 2 [Oscillospiraceae bacterium]